MEETLRAPDEAHDAFASLLAFTPAAIHLATDDEAHAEFPIPVGPYLLVKVDESRKSRGGIITPDSAAEAAADKRKATVFVAGAGCKQPWSRPGARLVISAHDQARMPVRVRSGIGGAEVDLRLVHEDTVFAVLKNSPEALAWLDGLFPPPKDADVKEFVVAGEKIAIPTVDGITPSEIQFDGPSGVDGSFRGRFLFGEVVHEVESVSPNACPINDKAVPDMVRKVLDEGVAALAAKVKS